MFIGKLKGAPNPGGSPGKVKSYQQGENYANNRSRRSWKDGLHFCAGPGE